MNLHIAIIFEVGGREISFEKDTVPFSEEITIQRGYDLIDEETEVFFGIGVALDCCNKGYGREICEKAGFSIDGEPIKQTTSIGEGVFYRMVAH